jgi:hypothetical protein
MINRVKKGLIIFLILILVLPFSEVFAAGYPTVVGSQTSSRAGNDFDDSVTLPAGVSAGDLIMVFHYSDANSTRTFPGPWVEIKDFAHSSNNFSIGIAYLIATGGETSVTVTKNTQERFSAVAIRISAASWHGTTPPEISTGVSAGSGTSVDPDAVTASWGSKTNLFIAAMAWDASAGTETVSSYPTNYSSNNLVGPSILSASNGAIATRELTAASDDPGAFVISVSDEWWAAALVVRPASGRELRLRNVRLRGNVRLK